MMPDFLSMVERGLKAVRFGIFQASDRLAETLDGLCRAPDPSTVSVGAPVGEGPSEVAFPSPSEGHPKGFSSLREMFDTALGVDPLKPQTDAEPHPQEVIEQVLSHHRLTWHVKRIECWDDDSGATSCGWFESSEQWREHVAELIAWKLFGEPA